MMDKEPANVMFQKNYQLYISYNAKSAFEKNIKKTFFISLNYKLYLYFAWVLFLQQ